MAVIDREQLAGQLELPGASARMPMRIVTRLAGQAETARLAGDIDEAQARFDDLVFYVRMTDPERRR